MKELKNKLKGLRDVMFFDNRFEIIFHRLLFPRTGIVTYRLKNLEIVIDHHGGDASGTRLCLVSDMYRKYIKNMTFSQPLNVMDLGANGGGFPLMLYADGYTIRNLTCVEMNPRTFARLQFNILHNLPIKTCLINGAICGERKSLRLFLGRGSTGDSILENEAPSDHRETAECIVEGYRLDNIFKLGFGDDRVDICKMDIEGAEYEVLSKPGHEALKKCRYLLIELHNRRGYPKTDAVSAIKRLGFREFDQKIAPYPNVYCFENKELK